MSLIIRTDHVTLNVTVVMDISPDLPFLNIHNPFTNEELAYTWPNINTCP